MEENNVQTIVDAPINKETEPTIKEEPPKLINKENLTLEELKNLIDTNEGFKAWLSSEKDRHFSTSLNTWKENNLGKEVEREITKRYPAETDEQKKLRELELKLQSIEQEAKLKEIKANTMRIINDKKLDSQILDFVLSDNEETTTSNIEKLESLIDKLVNERIEQKYKSTNNTPSKSVSDATVSEYDKLAQAGDVRGMLLSKLNIK